MNFAGNFIRLGDADISHLRRLVLQLTPEHWASDPTRQSRYEAHKDTQAIGLVYDADFRHANTTRLPPMEIFEPSMRPILAQIAAHYEGLRAVSQQLTGSALGYFVRASLVMMNPGGRIAPHQDKNFSLAHSHRVHVPLITNDRVIFSVGAESIGMKEGDIFEVNNRRIHSVVNDGREGRVHLILDWVNRGEQCCCADKTHPGVTCSPEACLQTDRLKIPCNCFPEECPPSST